MNQNLFYNQNSNFSNNIKYNNLDIKKEPIKSSQAPIKKFIKSHKKNENINISKSKITENKNNNIFYYTTQKKYYPISLKENNTVYQINNNQNNQNENIKPINNHWHHEIDMTTKRNIYMNNNQQNRDGGKINLQEYIKLYNNNDNINFIQNLRKYTKDKKERNTTSSIKFINEQNGRKSKNYISNIIDEKSKYNKDIINTNINYHKDNPTKNKKSVIKNNNFRNSSIPYKNLQKYSEKGNQNDLNKVYIKKHHNNNKKIINQPKKFINIKFDKNENFILVKENKLKCFKFLEDKKNEYFFLKGKEKQKILEQKLIEFFHLNGKEKKDKIFKLENIERFIIEGKEEKNKNNMKMNEKIREILLLLEQYNLNDEGRKLIINKLNYIIESNKPKKNKLDENVQKNANDNISIETNQNNSENKNKQLINVNKDDGVCSSVTNKKKKNHEEDFSICQKLYGFKNEGNNCYLNSSLQLLTRIKELKDEVINFNENFQDNDTQGKLIIEFRNMLNIINNSYKDDLILNPSKLKRIMGNVDERYNSNGQEDSNEFITNFINALLSETGNKELKVKKLKIVNELEKRPYENLYKKFYQRKGDSFILDLFYGISKLTKFCKKCENINSIKFNVYNMLEFPLYNLAKYNKNKDILLKELYKNYIEEIKCDGICNTCSSDQIYSKTSIYTSPKYLMICFQRAYENEYFYNNVIYPKNIQIKNEYENKNNSYLLDCVIERSGGFGFGHYTALVPFDNDNNEWLRFSDSYCNKSKVDFQSDTALILLYKLNNL